MKKELNVGFIGSGFISRAHAQAFKNLPICFPELEAKINFKVICSTPEKDAKEAAEKYGFEEYETNWKKLVSRRDVDIVNILTPNNLHRDMAVAAAENGKHIMCEKPMSITVSEAEEMTEAVKEAKVHNMVCFNYRRALPVILAKEILISGKLGKIYSFRGQYLQDWLADPEIPMSWRLDKETCGTGTLGDIGSHVIDFALYLIGDIKRVNSLLKTWVSERPSDSGTGTERVEVDDEMFCTLEFSNGAVGRIEATRFAPGRKNFLGFEINCEKGSLFFDYEKMNELQICEGVQGHYTRVQTGPENPYGKNFWPIPALGFGFSEVKTIEIYDFVKGILTGENASPDFEEGLKNQRVLDAIIESAVNNSWVNV